MTTRTVVPAAAHLLSIAAALVVAGAVLFNAALALVNAHVQPIGAGEVAVVQAGLTGAALLLVLAARPTGVVPWLVYLWIAGCGFLVLSLIRGRIDPRYLADMLTILVFVMLGMTLRARSLIATLVTLQGLLTAAAAWELVDPQGFSALFMVRDYYVNTRAFLDDAVWSGPENLFLASERPGGRLIGAGLEAHRASSLFLEPVSLGNWTVVVTLAVAALRPGRAILAFLVATNLFLLFASDGRLAFAINLVLIGLWPVLPRLPVWLPALFLPLMFMGLLGASTLQLLGPPDDTLGGRFEYSVQYLSGLSARDLLGFYDKGGVVAADSGWAYLILTQSIFGLLGMWLVLFAGPRVHGPEGRRFIAGVALFVVASLPVSYSLFSIKTAALLWAMYGFVLNSRSKGRVPAGEAEAKGMLHSKGLARQNG